MLTVKLCIIKSSAVVVHDFIGRNFNGAYTDGNVIHVSLDAEDGLPSNVSFTRKSIFSKKAAFWLLLR